VLLKSLQISGENRNISQTDAETRERFVIATASRPCIDNMLRERFKTIFLQTLRFPKLLFGMNIVLIIQNNLNDILKLAVKQADRQCDIKLYACNAVILYFLKLVIVCDVAILLFSAAFFLYIHLFLSCI